MSYMSRIYAEIQELYPNNIKKQRKLGKDFNNWVNGKYEIPKTEEIRKLILKYEGGK